MKVKSKSTMIGDLIFCFVCVLVSIICLLPLVNLAAKSLSGTEYLIRHEVYLLPKALNFDAYAKVLGDVKYVRAFFWTAGLTIVCTIWSLTITALCAYPLIYENLKGRNVLNILITITMYFNAGTIPNYLLMKQFNLIDNPLVLIIPSCLSVYNMIIMRSFFYGIPDSLRESAEIDGASYIKILTSIYIPLSKPVFATLALFYAVGRWNGYTDSLLYITKNKFYTLQHLLYNILNSINSVDVGSQEDLPVGLGEALKSAIVMFSTVPILLIYPWLQKYFIAGATLGAVKE